MIRAVPEAALDLIREFEGCKLHAYKDPVGIPTIGVGHTGPDVRMGQCISQEQADALLERDVADVADKIERASKVALTDGQYGALVSFAFNLGFGRLLHSTLWAKLQRGDAAGAAAEFKKWCHAGGKALPGLVRRREAERKLFVS